MYVPELDFKGFIGLALSELKKEVEGDIKKISLKAISSEDRKTMTVVYTIELESGGTIKEGFSADVEPARIRF